MIPPLSSVTLPTRSLQDYPPPLEWFTVVTAYDIKTTCNVFANNFRNISGVYDVEIDVSASTADAWRWGVCVERALISSSAPHSSRILEQMKELSYHD